MFILKNYFFMSILLFSSLTVSLNATISLNEEIGNMGKSLYTQVGFYSTCINKKIIKKNRYVMKYIQFKASNYLALTKPIGHMDDKVNNYLKKDMDLTQNIVKDAKALPIVKTLEDTQKKWFIKGTKGIVVSDPKISDDTFKLTFDQKNCAIVDKILTANYNMLYNTVFK